MSLTNLYFALGGAGSLALAQNLGDYRIDEEVISYVFNPAKTFFLRFFGKKAVSKLEMKGKAALHDTAAKLDVLLRAPVTSAEELKAKVEALAAEVKAKL